MSRKLRTACWSSACETSAAYVSDGGKWVKMRLPSMPCQLKLWCGNAVLSFQEIFWVRNQRKPARRASWGSAPE